MIFEFNILVGGCLLGAIHIFLAVRLKLRQYGHPWGSSARDEVLPPPSIVLARLMRAQANYFETFPIVVAGIAMLGIAGLNSRWTALGAIVWLVARALYLPLYAAGVPMVRTIAFIVSVVGIITLFWPLLSAGIQASALLG